MTGVYPQNLHVFRDDVPTYIQGRLESALTGWNEHTSQSHSEKNAVAEVRGYYQSEIERFKQKWGKESSKRQTRRAKRKKRLFRP